MAALKTYNCGDIILNCEPMAHVIDETQKSLRCDHCLESSSDRLFLCSKCKNMYYCGKQCQKSDWRFHKNECNLYAQHYPLIGDDYLTRLLIRLWTLIDKNDKNSVHKRFALHNGSSRTMYEMESHEQLLRADSSRMRQFAQICDKFNACQINYSVYDVFLMFGFIIINAFSIYDIDINDSNQLFIVETGHALYPSGGYYNHSCAPNACSVYSSYHLQIRAIKPIAVGEEIFIHYILLDLPKNERKAKLKEHYYFDCLCARCVTDDSIVNYKRFNELKDQLQQIILAMGKDDDTVGNDCELFDELLATAEQIYGRFHPDLTTLMMAICVHKINNARTIYSAKCDDQLFLDKLENNIRIVFGENHKLYKLFCENKSVLSNCCSDQIVVH